MNVRQFPIRERKYARTKLAMVNAAVEALEEMPLEAISVKSLCYAAEVSEATFFNYFDKKTDVLDYYIQLWLLEIGWHIGQISDQGLIVIDAMFERAAQRFKQRPGLMAEVVAYQARQREKLDPVEIGVVERLFAFDDKPGIEVLPAVGLDTIWVPNVHYAIEQGDLPPNAHMPTILVGLVSIFYGVPMALHQSNPAAISTMYRHQLTVFWAGIMQTGGSRA